VLVARSLVCAHPGAAEEGGATRPLDLDVAPGEWVVVVGPNGSGKTALLLTLAGLVPPLAGAVRLERNGDRPAVGVVFQEPETQLVTDSVAREIAFPLENLGWSRADIDARVSELVSAFGLEALAGASPLRLSGGEMQRTALAAAVAPRPRLLLLDEPAAYLDARARESLVSSVARLRAEHGVAIAWTACERDECPEADRAIVLEAHSPRAEVACPSADPNSNPRAAGRAPGELLWSARGLELTRGDARGARRIWGDLEFEIRAGETWAIVGPNGSGKTSLLDVLAGWLRPTSGRLDSSVLENRSHTLGYLGQFPEFQLFAATALEDVSFGIRARTGLRGANAEERARAALAAAGFEPSTIAARAPESLSLGERRRLALAGVLAGQPSVLLLDEPTVGLDREARTSLLRAVAARSAAGTTVVVASHDPAWAERSGVQRLDLNPFADPLQSP
jgi:energy-coupling factor transport system ATP-binding protein